MRNIDLTPPRGVISDRAFKELQTELMRARVGFHYDMGGEAFTVHKTADRPTWEDLRPSCGFTPLEGAAGPDGFGDGGCRDGNHTSECRCNPNRVRPGEFIVSSERGIITADDEMDALDDVMRDIPWDKNAVDPLSWSRGSERYTKGNWVDGQREIPRAVITMSREQVDNHILESLQSKYRLMRELSRGSTETSSEASNGGHVTGRSDGRLYRDRKSVV